VGKSAGEGSETHRRRQKKCHSTLSLETIGGTMSQVDPWEKAADCERALRITVDSIQREILSNIREFWIALANERPFLSEQDLAAEIEVISDFHATLDRNIHA
jgi:hypothetical protein